MASKNEMTPDEAEEKVLSELPRLSATALEAACEAVNVDVEEAVKGNKKKLRKLLTNHLDTKADDDDMGDYLRLVDHLFPTVPVKPDEKMGLENIALDLKVKHEWDQEKIRKTDVSFAEDIRVPLKKRDGASSNEKQIVAL